MGIPVEYNDVLALRPYDCGDDYAQAQCIPKELSLSLPVQHKFIKLGCRVFHLNKSIPLVVTEGSQRFTRVVGLVVIQCFCIESDPSIPEIIYTTGTYRINRLFSEEESAQWLTFLNPDQKEQLQILSLKDE